MTSFMLLPNQLNSLTNRFVSIDEFGKVSNVIRLHRASPSTPGFIRMRNSI